MMLKISQIASSKKLYKFELKYWPDVDKRFETGNKFGATYVSEELHKDIETLVEYGYIIRNNVQPTLLKPRKTETLFGKWISSDLASEFMMYIEGKRKEEDLEEIGGLISDGLGIAIFYGDRDDKKISFTKEYLENAHSIATKEKIIYQGERRGKLYAGRYNLMHMGEIPYLGDFILAEKKEDLPSE